ncbi:MAG: hypothetical protein K2Z81_07845 [Cyanobacteria bacterium]|nr:hypothetical protein [Cyanobacteriota bacterium]
MKNLKSICILFIIASLFFSSGSAHVHEGDDESWRSLAVRAYYASSREKKVALELYRQALEAARHAYAPTDVVLDLKLTLVDSLIQNGQLDEAAGILRSCYESIARTDMKDLRLLRYWRRTLSLANARKDDNSALLAQSQIVELVGEKFDRGCHAYIEELKTMQRLLMGSHRFYEAFEIDQEMRRLAAKERIPYIKERLEHYRKSFSDTVLKTALNPSKIGVNEFDVISKTIIDPHQELSIWKQCIREHRIQHRLRERVTARILELLHGLGSAASNDERAIEVIGRAEEIFERLGRQFDHVDAETASLVFSAYKAIKDTRADNHCDLVLKMQIVSMYAHILAQKGEVNTAMSVMDNLVVPPDSVVNCLEINGILQARYSIAEAWLRLKQTSRAREQFSKLQSFLAQQNKLSKEEKAKFKAIWSWKKLSAL